MASMQHNDRHVGGEKASTSMADEQIILPGGTSGDGKRNDRQRRETTLVRSGPQKFAWIVDLVLLLLLAVLIVGGIFGYRALKEVYDPVWDSKTVEFCIKVSNVPRNTVYDVDGENRLTGKQMWVSDRVDGDCLGTVRAAFLEAPKPGETTSTLYLTVETTAKYRTGEGYYVNDTQLLAGTIGQYRVHGMTFDGVMISMHETETP